MRCVVLGSGTFGTALAIQLGRCGHDVALWDHEADRAAAHEAARRNLSYLKDAEIPDKVHFTGDMPAALSGADLVVAVVPTTAMREVMAAARTLVPPGATIVCASKGVELGTLMTMDEVLRDVLPGREFCVLSGPSFAVEVAQNLPTAVVVAGPSHELADTVAAAFHGSNFRVYHSDDVTGVEIAGALKNVMAIACGIADGMGLGNNARAAIMTRGLAEMTRLGLARGARAETFAGLAGMGDLVLTCTGDLSRNRRVGLALGRGRALDDIVAELGQVAEGVVTARSAFLLAQREGVEMPISEQVYKIVHEGKPAQVALVDLLMRARKREA